MSLTEKSPQNIWRSITQLAAAAASSTTLAIWNRIQKCKRQNLSYEDFIGNNVFFILTAFSKCCNEHWSHEYLSWESRNLQFEHWVIWNSLCYHCLQADTTGYMLPYLQKPKTTWDQSDVQLRVWEIRCHWELYLFFFYSVQAKALMDLTCKNVCSIFFASSFFFFFVLWNLCCFLSFLKLFGSRILNLAASHTFFPVEGRFSEGGDCTQVVNKEYYFFLFFSSLSLCFVLFLVGRSFQSLISNKNFSSFKNDVVQLPPSTKSNRATEESTQENHHNLNEYLELRKKIKISPLQNPSKNPPPKKWITIQTKTGSLKSRAAHQSKEKFRRGEESVLTDRKNLRSWCRFQLSRNSRPRQCRPPPRTGRKHRRCCCWGAPCGQWRRYHQVPGPPNPRHRTSTPSSRW